MTQKKMIMIGRRARSAFCFRRPMAALAASIIGSGFLAMSLVYPVSDSFARGRAGAPVTVDCDAGDSLQAKLNKGFDGNTFNVAGTCNEVITIELSNIVIDGLSLDPSRRGEITFDGDADPGLVLVRGSNVLIKNMTIRHGSRAGIVVQLSSSVVLRRNMIRHNTNAGVVVTAGGHGFIGSSIGEHGMPNDACGGCRFFGTAGNIIKFNGIGIVSRHNAAVDVFHNQILSNNGAGITLSNSGSGDIDGNDIIGNGAEGIRLVTNAAIRLDDDEFHGRTAVETVGNTIEGNATGIYCKVGAAISGVAPDWGNGNTTNEDTSGSCHKAGSLGF